PPLPSLAKQWALEDEEEQERQRRQLHRSLSLTTDEDAPELTQNKLTQDELTENGDRPAVERLQSVEEEEIFKPPPSVLKDEEEDVHAILRTRQERRQRRQVIEAVQAPIWERLGSEEGRDNSGPGQVKQQLPGPKKELEIPPRRRPSQEQQGPWAREENSAGRKPEVGEKQAPEKAPVSEKTSISEKVAAAEKIAVSEKRRTSEKKSVPEKIRISEKTPAAEKTLVPEKTSSSERRLVSEKASVFERSLASEKTTETKLAPKSAATSEQRQAQEPPTYGGRQPITNEKRRDLPEKMPPPSAEMGEQGDVASPTVASRLPPFTLQVKIPSKETEAGIVSPTQVICSSSLKRSSPRTISFRMSPRKDNSETTFSRSASMRLPASNAKLGEKLERYHTAIQRSESIKSQGSSRTEFFVAPMGVARKRDLFENELKGQSRAEPASTRRENLKLSGVVTSRLNLWISRTQESGDQDSQVVQKDSAATRRSQWRKKLESSLEAEV
ncbi:ladinin-1, partial [Dasypus novemcinctus]|uniref:ladinin-1 n=1 Tax=Dasypus novemcinctus TaxID=9361 RepID=UPI00265F804F